MKKLCLIYQKEVAEHDFGPSHPLRADRLALYVQQLHNDNLVDRLGLSIVDEKLEISDIVNKVANETCCFCSQAETCPLLALLTYYLGEL